MKRFNRTGYRDENIPNPIPISFLSSEFDRMMEMKIFLIYIEIPKTRNDPSNLPLQPLLPPPNDTQRRASQ